MNNFPVNVDGKEYWISRSVSVAGFIFCWDGELLVLANQRGLGAPDFQGYWNVPCGYLDWNETTKEACSREIKEETNLTVNPHNLQLFDFIDNPKSSRQNVTFCYYHFSNKLYKGQTIYAKGQEKDEVSDCKWIPVSKLDEYKWAFDQDELIRCIVLQKSPDWVPDEVKQNFLKL